MLRVQTEKTRMRIPRISLSRDLKLSLLAGVATGLVGVIIFATVHALLIAPIWGSLLRGLPVAVIGGPAAAWAFEEIRAAGRLSTRLRDGLLFGGLLWLTLVPMNAFDVLLRKTGMRTAMGDWEVLVSVIFALAGGALAGWVLTRGRRGVIAGGLATLVLAMAMGGPIPITATPRAAGLFASFLAIYILSGTVLVVIRAGLARATSRPSTAVI